MFRLSAESAWPGRWQRVSLAMASFAWGLAATATAGTVTLRGGAEPITATALSFTTDGLRVTRAGGSTELLAWDLVRGVEGQPVDDAAKEHLAIAEDLWRARARVQRGDTAMAGPLLERHFGRFRGTTSETALVVAEGLLRCRLASNEWERAVVPALELARLRRAGVVTDRYARLPPVIDETTLLCPDLSPSWLPDARTKALADEVTTLARGDGSVARLAELYAALLRGERLAAGRESDPGAALLLAIAAIDSRNEESLAASRKELAAAVRDLGPWAKAWASHALGRALVAENDPVRRMDGVLELLRVVAEYANEAPGLARRSLSQAAGALRALGDAESAATLERELVALGATIQPPSPPITTPSRSPPSP